MPDEAPWLLRTYDASTDENAVVYLWLKSFAHSPHGRSLGADLDGSDAERAYWAAHRLVVGGLLVKADTQVLCDPEAPGVIWAFACTKGNDVIHYAVVKRRFRGESAAMFSALLGDRFERPCTLTHDMIGTGLCVPSSWRLNPYAAFT